MEGPVSAEFDEEAGENPPSSHSGGQAEGREDIHGQPCQEGASKIRVTPRRRSQPHRRGRAGEATPVHDFQEGNGCLSSSGTAGNRPRPRGHRREAGHNTQLSRRSRGGGEDQAPRRPAFPARKGGGHPGGEGARGGGRGGRIAGASATTKAALTTA